METNVKPLRLDTRQLVSLVKYVEAHKAEFQRDRPAYQEVAERAERDLGFKIGGRHVRTASKASGSDWMPRRSDFGAVGRNKGVNARILARAIMEIADALDIKIDPRVEVIASGHGKPESNGQH